jgi:nucleolar protein 9
MPIDDRIKIAHDSSASRVYDVLLDSPTVPLKAKRQFVMDFMGHYHLLVDDRIGSRVGDRCWAFADTYLKVLSPPFLLCVFSIVDVIFF